jgi:hypothetical protein
MSFNGQTTVMLGMESLETTRLKLDMQFACKILFGIVDRDYSTMFSLNAAQRTRGHVQLQTVCPEKPVAVPKTFLQ